MYFSIRRLKILCNEIKRRTECQDLGDRSEFLHQLQIAGAAERSAIARYFCQLSWNLGSLQQLGVLQRLRILNATEYILSIQNGEEQQCVLNDFFEGEYELLRNLFVSAFYDADFAINVSIILEESLQRLFRDLLSNPKLGDLEYLGEVTKDLNADLVLKIMQKHIGVLLELQSSSINDAYRHCSAWINEGVDDILFMKDLYDKLLRATSQPTLAHLFKVSSVENFKHWKFYIIILQTLASLSSQQDGAFMRKYLSQRLRQVASVPTKKAMLHLLLTARAATATTMNIQQNVDSYAKWYKQNICEMKISLKTEEFQNVLDLLQQCVDYEMEKHYLEVHATLTIAPPVHCGKLVQMYKSKCKSRLSHLKEIVEGTTSTAGSILIEDSN